MSRGYSEVTFLGNVVRDPVCKTTVNGKFYCRFAIAIENRYKQGDKYVKTTDFFNLVAWEKMAQYCEKQVKKGTRLFVVAAPKNYKPQNAQFSIVFFTISFLNVENHRKSAVTESASVPMANAAEETENHVPRELPEDAETIHEGIDHYHYFDEEDYSEL